MHIMPALALNTSWPFTWVCFSSVSKKLPIYTCLLNQPTYIIS